MSNAPHLAKHRLGVRIATTDRQLYSTVSRMPTSRAR
jgi:hypothetical protein